MVFNKLIKRGIDNLRFALNLDDYVPDHIRQELTVGQTRHRTSKIAQGVEKLIFDRDDDLDINNIFSLQMERFYNNEQQFRRQNQVDERLFSEIQGYNDIKELMMRCILSPEPVHVILDGPPASGKTIFLLCMQKKLYSSYFVDCTNASGPGMIEYLFKHDVKYLLLDEVEKMSKNDQNVLLNVLETGALTSTKVRKTASKEMNLFVFATTNDIDSLSPSGAGLWN
jgi:DNA replicative helicase MCM subunit Mcm2 (Cdc46/Mcm family)